MKRHRAMMVNNNKLSPVVVVQIRVNRVACLDVISLEPFALVLAASDGRPVL